MQWAKITLVGVGLLGGSIGLAARRRRLAGRVVGYVRRLASVAECEGTGAVDAAGIDLCAAVEGADLVVLCTPIARMRELTEQMLPALRPGALVTDVGSVKEPVVRELEPLVDRTGAHFIGSHPMAGAEKMGVQAARADLFEKAVCVLTRTAESPPDMVERLTAFWAALGGLPLRLPADVHDELVSRSSHLPHVVAAVLVHCVLNPALPEAQARLCANGFRDATRVASGSPEMWRDIALANRDNLARVLDGFVGNLESFRRLLESGEAAAIEEFFVQAKRRRDAWCAAGASPSPE